MNTWLSSAIVYEIYPQSFYDANGDGIGDLQGIIQKLDYIIDCGFNAIWLNPICESDFQDAGYDITDYYNVANRYGSNEDFKTLVQKCHSKGVRIIFDLVPGHTSIKHPWFVESAKCEENEYTNRYIWTGPTFDCEEGIAGYSQRNANYITNFFWHQPALNYGYAHPDPKKPWQLPVDHPDCQATRQELKNIIDFWMDMGVDAFRVDMAASCIKNDIDGTFTRQMWQEIRMHMAKKNPQCLLISEWGEPRKAIEAGFHCDFYLHNGPAYTSLFRNEPGRNTTCLFTGHSYFNTDGKGNINTFLDEFLSDHKHIGDKGLVGLITGNHDIPRLSYMRTIEEQKAAFVFLFTLPGVPFVYYGDEIGMRFMDDLPSKEGGYYRTGTRTPMQWTAGYNHGFSTSDTPYLPTDSEENAPTVEQQATDPNSLLNFVRTLILLRKKQPALEPDGDLEIINSGYPLSYVRKKGNKKIYVAINPSKNTCVLPRLPFKQIYFSQNINLQNDSVILNGVSFLIGDVQE